MSEVDIAAGFAIDSIFSESWTGLFPADFDADFVFVTDALPGPIRCQSSLDISTKSSRSLEIIHRIVQFFDRKLQ